MRAPRPAPHGVRPATPADAEAIELTLGAAFFDDPIAEWLFGRRLTVERVGALDTVMSAKLIPQELSTVTDGTEAVAIWAAPKRFRIPVKDFIPDLPRTAWMLGLGGTRRMVQMAEVEKLHPREPHYYLAVLGTHPDHQAKGFGSAAMAPTMARADAEGVACYLESSKEANVPFYERHGFEVTGTHDLADGKGPRLWLMWREPEVPAD